MRIRKCWTPKCNNSFESVDGRRRLCDGCRSKRRITRNARPWHHLPAAMTIQEYKRLRRLIDYAKFPYARQELKNWAVQRANWARVVLYEGSHEPCPPRPEIARMKRLKRLVKVKVVRKPLPGECFNCGLRLLLKDESCVRCGWTNK